MELKGKCKMDHKFKACRYLDFNGSYNLCHKEMLANGKVFWMREKPIETTHSMVQFCKRIGRLNHPESCTSKIFKMCDLYEEAIHSVPINEIS